MGPPWLAKEKHFQTIDYQKPGKRYFTIGFCKCSKATDVQVLRSPQAPQKLLDFDNAVTHFCPDFPKLQKLGCYTPYPLVITSLVLCLYTKALEKVSSRQHAKLYVVNYL